MERTTEVVFLRGKRINLRPLSKGDVPDLLRWINDPDVRRYVTHCFPMMEQEEVAWVEKLHERKPHDFALGITLAKDSTLIGTIGLHRVNWVDRTAVTGTIIGERVHRNKGYGTEAKMLLLDYAFNRLNLRKVCSNVFACNPRSVAYSKRCGYRVEGALKRQFFVDGKYVDQIMLAVFRKDWLPIWERYKREHLR
jgi:RimJ/RimL family protein N-acetyltransferase